MAADFPLSPCLIKGGIVTMDPDTTALRSVIAFQYKPDSLTRTLQIQAVRGDHDCRPKYALRPGCAKNSATAWHVVMGKRLKP